MKISVDQLSRGVYQVGRTLLSPQPTYANDAMATSFAIEDERRRQCKPLLDVWFEIHDVNGKHYIMEKSNGSGEYLRQLPPTVPPESVVKIVLPKNMPPAFDLLDQIEGLFRKFQKTTQFIDEPTNENMELVGGAAAQVQIGDLLQLIGNIRLAAQPGYNEKITSQLIEQLNEALLSYVGTRDFPQFEKSVSIACKTIETMRASLLSDCLLSSFFRVFHDLCTAVFEHRINLGTPEADAQAEYLLRVTGLYNASKRDPLFLLQFTVARAGRDGVHDIVVRMASEYLEKGNDLIDEALDAPTRHLHGDALYRAAVVLFCSRQLFKELLKSAPLLPGVNVEDLQLHSNVSEEDMVKVFNALLFALENRGDERLDVQRQKLRELAAQNGSNAVEAKITELIEQKFYYPRIFRKCLQGGTKPAGE